MSSTSQFLFHSCTASRLSKNLRGVSGGSEPSAAMAEPTKQERLTKLMEALEAFDELEFEIQCFAYEQFKEKISTYCCKFALAEVDLKDEEIQCKEDFALFIARNCFWSICRNILEFDGDDLEGLLQLLQAMRTVVDHLKVLLQPAVDWHKSKTLSALARAFCQIFEQSDICGFYACHSAIRPRCGDVAQVAFIQPGTLSRKMREDVIQVAKMALRTQQFKTIVNDDLSAAVKDFLKKVRIWCQNAGKFDEKVIKRNKCVEGKKMICPDCENASLKYFNRSENASLWKGCQRACFALPWKQENLYPVKNIIFFGDLDSDDEETLSFSAYTKESQNLHHATSKLLDLSLASELQDSDPQPEISAASLSSWSVVDRADQEKALEVEVESIASCNSVDSQTSCLSGSGGPHCFLTTCRFKCVEDETSLVREVLGKDAKLLKRISLLTKSFVIMKLYFRWCCINSSSLG